LKTPLTVLANEAAANEGPLAERWRGSHDHAPPGRSLSGPRPAAGALDVLGSRTEFAPVVNDLARVLKRMHADKDLSIAITVPPGLVFRGEREDLEEMAGNLIDNACKWADGKIVVEAGPVEGGKLFLRVGDDGPGLDVGRTFAGDGAGRNGSTNRCRARALASPSCATSPNCMAAHARLRIADGRAGSPA